MTRPVPGRPRSGAPARTAGPVLAVLVAALAGCGTELTPAEMSRSCSDLASEVAKAGLTGSPTQAQVKAVADDLDALLPGLRDPRLHDAAIALHTHLHAMEIALGTADADRAAELADAAKQDVAKAARVCGLPPARFLGG